MEAKALSKGDCGDGLGGGGGRGFSARGRGEVGVETLSFFSNSAFDARVSRSVALLDRKVLVLSRRPEANSVSSV